MPRSKLTEPWWTPWPGVGPGHDLLGDLTGKVVVELGCGAGDNAAAFAKAGAHVVGIDSDTAKVACAVARWGHLSDVEFHRAEASEFLAHTPDRYEVVCSIFGALSFSPATPMLRRITSRLQPSGTLAASIRLPCAGDTESALPSGVADWQRLLLAHGLRPTTFDVIPHPTEAAGRACLVVTASRELADVRDGTGILSGPAPPIAAAAVVDVVDDGRDQRPLSSSASA
jgi:SAM-dependent methyltransferase